MVLVGEPDPGNPNTVSQDTINQWIHEGVVECWGFSANINLTIAESNIMVLPSYREGLPKSLLEAAACGRAVITTDVPGCRDAIEENVTGLLVPVKDHILLAEAIKSLCNDDARRHAMGIAGRQLALQEFDIQKVVARHLQIYQGLENQN